MPVASLNTSWFALIGLLWAGYFVLEGFDFGVGILTPLLARDDLDRRVCINTIGPTWDANEVWVIVAGGATFAAFPTWYATMFSAFYLPLLVILVALIVRGISFEFRGKGRGPAWPRAFDRTLFWGSLLPAILWGVAFTDLLHGLDIASGPRYLGGFAGLLQPVALLGGLVSLTLFCLHGAIFLSAKTTGELSGRAHRAVLVLAGPAVLGVAGLAAWLSLSRPAVTSTALSGAVPLGLVALSVALIGAGGLFSVRRHDGSAFLCTALAILSLAAALFSALFPNVMVSSVGGQSLTLWSAASAHETLFVMTIVAAIFTPFVLGYQTWSYWVFRQRISRPPQTVAAGRPSQPPQPDPGGAAETDPGLLAPVARSDSGA
jgi:cytochrome d ubiquinol oxidase subunit II